MRTIIIGNIISFVAAVLLGLSGITKHPKRVFVYQVLESALLALASFVFGSYAAVVSALVSGARSCFVVFGKYTRGAMLVFSVLGVVIGFVTNTKGTIGLLPVLATLEFTYVSYRYKDSIKGLKWGLILNLALWDVYAFRILDFSSGIAWIITLAATAVSLVGIYRKERTNRENAQP